MFNRKDLSPKSYKLGFLYFDILALILVCIEYVRTGTVSIFLILLCTAQVVVYSTDLVLREVLDKKKADIINVCILAGCMALVIIFYVLI